ncbi:lysine--tRNA ligase [bacterium]|nr:lysine--tRNA ligase [bacterium]|tara:strand:+ start:17088 stop:18560 length:1473 start_codon:yes stop_codon:yes gene_type:complete
MASLSELRDERIKKLKILEEKGINPYPRDARQDFTLFEAVKDFSKLSKRKKAVSLVGRVIGLREHGGSIFLDLDDGTGRLQGFLKKNEIGEEAFNLFKDTVDMGDFIEITGSLFVTKKKEKSILAKEWRMLSKSLLPLPDKWHGLQDVEERFRKRYLDIVMNDEVKNRFLIKTKIFQETRAFLDKEEFVEVETPMLQTVPGGATAKPFKTKLNALNMELYLRVAPELHLKELLVAGYPKVYELGRSFRNEGIDVTHNPEFTSLEVYTAYSTPEVERKRIEKLMKSVVQKTLKKKKFEHDGNTIDFGESFEVITFRALIKKYALIGEDVMNNREELALKAQQFGISVAPHDGIENILDDIYKKACRPKLLNPTFIIDYPAPFSPLAKRKEDNPELIDRFQLVAGGLELVNGYLEINDPQEQHARFLEQEEKRKKGDEEAQTKNDSFVEALEHGMPPATGWAIGMERFVMLLTNTKNIREVIIFPTLKPKSE